MAQQWSVSKLPIDIEIPFHVNALGINHVTGWVTVSCLQGERYKYFVTRKKLKFGIHENLPKDALNFEQGLCLVKL